MAEERRVVSMALVDYIFFAAAICVAVLILSKIEDHIARMADCVCSDRVNVEAK